MRKSKYRVGIIGCGGTSRLFLQGWAAWPKLAEVAAVCDINPAQMRRRQEEFPAICGKAKKFLDYRKMLDEAALDIVCVCSFSDKHLEHAGAAMAAGKHVFVEKPVGYDLEEARRFQHLAFKHADVKVAAAYSLRYYKAFMDLKAVIDSGTLGRISSAEISYSHGFSRDGRGVDEAGQGEQAPARRAGSRGRHPFEDRGGNYIRSSELAHSTHPWDLARYFLGEAKDVFCTSHRGVEMGMLWMESGSLAHVMAGNVRSARVGYMQQQIVQVHGSLGSAWLTRETRAPYRWQAHYKTDGDICQAPSVSELPESTHGTVLRTRNLLDAIEGKAELICSLLDGTRTTELLHALWLSQRMQVKVPVLPANHSG